MTSPPRPVEVECPACGHTYEDYVRASVNLALGEEWTDEEIRKATTATCPECGHVVEFDSLTGRPNWDFEFGPAHGEEGEKN